MIRVGLVLVAAGLAIKGTIKVYREIKLMSRMAAQQYEATGKQQNNFERGVGFEPVMTHTEAQHILGVYKSAADITREDIVKRHRKLMMINHPDNKGSMYISTKINEAKEVLLKQ